MTGWVLCAVDESPQARGIVLVAARFAQELGLRLMAVHVVDDQLSLPDGHGPAAAERQRPPPSSGTHLLESATCQPWIRWDTVRRLAFGDPADELLRLAHEPDMRFLVVGSGGAGRPAGAYLGGVSRRLAGESPRPVLVVPPRAARGAEASGARQGAASILCALDGSGESELALRYAAEIGWLCGARLLLAHVLGPPSAGPSTGSAALPDAERNVGATPLERAAEALDDGAQVELRLEFGDPRIEIDRLAARERCEIIAVGARGRDSLPPAPLGPVSAGLAASGSRPVLIVTGAAASSSLARCCPWLAATARSVPTARAV